MMKENKLGILAASVFAGIIGITGLMQLQVLLTKKNKGVERGE